MRASIPATSTARRSNGAMPSCRAPWPPRSAPIPTAPSTTMPPIGGTGCASPHRRGRAGRASGCASTASPRSPTSGSTASRCSTPRTCSSRHADVTRRSPTRTSSSIRFARSSAPGRAQAPASALARAPRSQPADCAGSARRCSAARPAGRRPWRRSARGGPIALERRAPGARVAARRGARRGRLGRIKVEARGRCWTAIGWTRRGSPWTAPRTRSRVEAGDIARVAGDLALPGRRAVVAAHARRAGLLRRRLELRVDGEWIGIDRGPVGFRTLGLRHERRRGALRRQRRAGLLPRRLLDAARHRAPGARAARRCAPRSRPVRDAGDEHAARRRHDGLRERRLLRPVRRARHPGVAGLHVRQHGLSRRTTRRSSPRRSTEATPAARAAARARRASPCLCGNREVRAAGGDVGRPRERWSPRLFDTSCRRSARS